MPSPSQLMISTNAVIRLLKEELSYRRELRQQMEQISLLEKDLAEGKGNEEGNGEYMLNQRRKAKEETEAMFAPIRKRIEDAVKSAEAQIEAAEQSSQAAEKSSDETSSSEVHTAKETVERAKVTLQEMKEDKVLA